jgi:hypothetical protein
MLAVCGGLSALTSLEIWRKCDLRLRCPPASIEVEYGTKETRTKDPNEVVGASFAMRAETLGAHRANKFDCDIDRAAHATMSSCWAVLWVLAVVNGLLGAEARAQTLVGPSPPTQTTTINAIGPGTTTVVGNTLLAPTGSSAAGNAASGGIIIVDSTAGPNPGPISATTAAGNVFQVNDGGLIEADGANGLTLSTSTGNVVFANVGTGRVEIEGAEALRTAGVGAILGTSGGTIDATNVTLISNSTVSTISERGAVAQGGGVINLHSGTSIATTSTSAGTFLALGAQGTGSSVNADAQIPITLNNNRGLGIYDMNGGLVSLPAASSVALNGPGSVGVVADNTNVVGGTLGKGLTLNFNAMSGNGGAGVVAVRDGSISLDSLTVTGAGAGAGVVAGSVGSTGGSGSVTLTGQSVLNINAVQNWAFQLITPGTSMVSTSGSIGPSYLGAAGSPNGGLIAFAGSIVSDGTTINVTSPFGVGAFAGLVSPLPSTIDLTTNTITTSGMGSIGLEASSNGEITGRDSSVTTSGGNAALFALSVPSAGGVQPHTTTLIDLTNTNVQAIGPNTVGLASLNTTASLTNVVNLSGGSLTSPESTGIEAQGPLNFTASNGAVVTGGGGILIDAFDNPGPGEQPTLVRFTASGGSILSGDARAESGSEWISISKRVRTGPALR